MLASWDTAAALSRASMQRRIRVILERYHAESGRAEGLPVVMSRAE